MTTRYETASAAARPTALRAAVQGVEHDVGHDTALGPRHLGLLRELSDLKRIRSAGRSGSIATRLFAAGWQALVAGAAPEAVMASITASALAAGRLGDLDLATLVQLGLGPQDAADVLQRAFDEIGGVLEPRLAGRLRIALAEAPLPRAEAPGFVALLSAQPRAGVTCPGRPRLMLEPAENHAEHSLMVALYGVIAAPAYGADPTTVFLCGMGHHLHSAAMPDSGYTGEMLLGDKLDAVIDCARAKAFAELSPALGARLRAALSHIASDRTPEARAFHAADVIDRVIEIEQHLRAARTTMAEVLDVYGLVHAGPVKPFHDRVLAQVGLP